MNSRTDSPLSASDCLDVVGERIDGGVDMLVVTTGALDASDETCNRLMEKLSTYLHAALHPNFKNVYPAARDGRVRIFVSDSHEVSERAKAMVQSFALEAMARNVEVRIGSPVFGQAVATGRRDEAAWD